MILVVGGTGLVGSHVCDRLRAERQSVRALVRATSDPAKVERLAALGCELATGDLKNPAEIEAACKHISVVISTASSTLSRQPGDTIDSVDLHGQLTLVNAAKRAGIGRFVFVSFRDNKDVQHPLTKAKRAVEHALTNLDFTSIQASFFMEVWLSPALGFDYDHAKVRVYGDGLNPISWISYRDVAEFCVAAALRPVANRSVLEVGGPEALSPAAVVKIFEEESSQPFEVENMPEAQLRQQFDAAVDPLQKSFAGLMLQYAQGDEMQMGAVLQAIPVRLTSVRDYARAVLQRQSFVTTGATA